MADLLCDCFGFKQTRKSVDGLGILKVSNDFVVCIFVAILKLLKTKQTNCRSTVQ